MPKLKLTTEQEIPTRKRVILMQVELKKGFTLAELLIALAILGVIATFSIPKILVSSNNAQSNAIAKETMATIAGAYAAYKTSNTVTAATGPATLTPFMNYVSVDTSGNIDMDSPPSFSSGPCNTTSPCLRLHNGALLRYWNSDSFSGTSTTNAFHFQLDTDGKVSSIPALTIFIYSNGRLTTYSGLDSNTYDSGSNIGGANPAYEPTWLKW